MVRWLAGGLAWWCRTPGQCARMGNEVNGQGFQLAAELGAAFAPILFQLGGKEGFSSHRGYSQCNNL